MNAVGRGKKRLPKWGHYVLSEPSWEGGGGQKGPKILKVSPPYEKKYVTLMKTFNYFSAFPVSALEPVGLFSAA